MSIYCKQDGQCTYNLTLWHVCIMLTPPRLYWQPDFTRREHCEWQSNVADNSKTYSGSSRKVPEIYARFQPNFDCVRKVSVKVRNIWFHKNLSTANRGWYMWTDGRTWVCKHAYWNRKGILPSLDWLTQLNFVLTVGTVLKPQTERTLNTCREYDESLKGSCEGYCLKGPWYRCGLGGRIEWNGNPRQYLQWVLNWGGGKR